MSSFRPLLTREQAEFRLKLVFPPLTFDTVLSNQLASSAVVAMIYVGAVVDDETDDPVPEAFWARPATVLNMSDATLYHSSADDREAWAIAEARTTATVLELVRSWGVSEGRWYASNTRETLRDETWPKWLGHGAIRKRPGVAVTSPLPRWALTASFADLFDPALVGSDLTDAVEAWRDSHMGRGHLLRIAHQNALSGSVDQVSVVIPGYGVRNLEPGVASYLLKGVIEDWAKQRLAALLVVAISEPGRKVLVADAARMADAEISINVSELLPDAILLDVGANPPVFWLVEIVASDGVIDEDRKADLLAWAETQYIDPAHCRFLTVFTSRFSGPARRRLPDIAAGTHVWFRDEPELELFWGPIERPPGAGALQ